MFAMFHRYLQFEALWFGAVAWLSRSVASWLCWYSTGTNNTSHVRMQSGIYLSRSYAQRSLRDLCTRPSSVMWPCCWSSHDTGEQFSLTLKKWLRRSWKLWLTERYLNLFYYECHKWIDKHFYMTHVYFNTGFRYGREHTFNYNTVWH